jgi:hypothetical protein
MTNYGIDLWILVNSLYILGKGALIDEIRLFMLNITLLDDIHAYPKFGDRAGWDFGQCFMPDKFRATATGFVILAEKVLKINYLSGLSPTNIEYLSLLLQWHIEDFKLDSLNNWGYPDHALFRESPADYNEYSSSDIDKILQARNLLRDMVANYDGPADLDQEARLRAYELTNGK